MKREVRQKLVKLAALLDQRGMCKEADVVERILRNAIKYEDTEGFTFLTTTYVTKLDEIVKAIPALQALVNKLSTKEWSRALPEAVQKASQIAEKVTSLTSGLQNLLSESEKTQNSDRPE